MVKPIAAILFLTLFLIPSNLKGARPDQFKPFARATLVPKSDSGVSGTVDFTLRGTDLLVKAYVSNLVPGKHGFHVHQNGSCDGEQAEKAGDHYNPTGSRHGGPKGDHRHVGDFGNLQADGKGNAVLEAKIAAPKGNGFKSWNDLVGRSVIIHRDGDDLNSQPGGNSGDKIACGVIQANTPEGE